MEYELLHSGHNLGSEFDYAIEKTVNVLVRGIRGGPSDCEPKIVVDNLTISQANSDSNLVIGAGYVPGQSILYLCVLGAGMSQFHDHDLPGPLEEMTTEEMMRNVGEIPLNPELLNTLQRIVLESSNH